MNIVEYAKQFLGVKYTWGGESADEGWDCSGFIQELFKSQFKYEGDRTVAGIYNKFHENADHISFNNIEPGDLIFQRGFTHICMAINKNQVIEAGGEGRTPTKRGMVRVRHISLVNDVDAILRIFH